MLLKKMDVYKTHAMLQIILFREWIALLKILTAFVNGIQEQVPAAARGHLYQNQNIAATVKLIQMKFVILDKINNLM